MIGENATAASTSTTVEFPGDVGWRIGLRALEENPVPEGNVDRAKM
jgi:hypothetical protein